MLALMRTNGLVLRRPPTVRLLSTCSFRRVNGLKSASTAPCVSSPRRAYHPSGPAGGTGEGSPRGGDDDGGGFGGAFFNITEDDSELLPRNVQGMLKNDFFDYASRRCTLCNEPIVGSFPSHAAFPTHQARLGIVQRALTGFAGPPDLLSDRWWLLLHDTTLEGSLGFGRIPNLSHRNKRSRRRRVCYLLDFVQRRGFIRETLGIFRGGASLHTSDTSGDAKSSTSARGKSFQSHVIGGLEGQGLGIHADTTSFHRSVGFERFEMIGDNVVKFIIPDRLFRMFPPEDGGPTGQIALCQQMLDSNEGLLRIYDYLDLDRIIGVRMPNSKSKSDVVEALFGELQCFLWATEIKPSECGGLDRAGDMWLVGPDGFLLAPELRYARAVINHLMNEIAHCVLVWACESALENAREFIDTHYAACSQHVQTIIGGRRDSSRFSAYQSKVKGANSGAASGAAGGSLGSAQAAYLAARQIPIVFPGHPTAKSAKEFYVQTPLLKDHSPTVMERSERMAAARAPLPRSITAPYFSRIRNRVSPPLHTGTALSLFLKDGHTVDEFMNTFRSGLLDIVNRPEDEGSLPESSSPPLSPAPFALPTAAHASTSRTSCMAPPQRSVRLAYCNAITSHCATQASHWEWGNWWESLINEFVQADNTLCAAATVPLLESCSLRKGASAFDVSLVTEGVVLPLHESMALSAEAGFDVEAS